MSSEAQDTTQYVHHHLTNMPWGHPLLQKEFGSFGVINIDTLIVSFLLGALMLFFFLFLGAQSDFGRSF